jgi:hypothetical protein
MVKPGTDAGPTTTAAPEFRVQAEAPPARPSKLARMRARRAGFVAHLDSVAGEEGLGTLANDGRDAHCISDQLHEIAQQNTPTSARETRRATTRHRVLVGVAVCVLAVATLWIVDNVIGAMSSDSQPALVTSRTSVVVDDQSQFADCFTSSDVQPVYKAAAPFSSYRCGDGVRGVLAPGPITVAALALIVICVAFLAMTQARWQRKNAWY